MLGLHRLDQWLKFESFSFVTLRWACIGLTNGLNSNMLGFVVVVVVVVVVVIVLLLAFV